MLLFLFLKVQIIIPQGRRNQYGGTGAWGSGEGVERGTTDFLLNFQASNRKVEPISLISVNSGTLNSIYGEGRTHSILRRI